MTMKYNEDLYISEIEKYIQSTYDSHYTSFHDEFQTIDSIIATGNGQGFCLGNIMKYSQRYGQKGDLIEQRKDLMKIIHYAILMLYIHDTDK